MGESVWPGVLKDAKCRDERFDDAQNMRRVVPATIVHDDNLMWHVMDLKLEVEMLDGRSNAMVLIPGWDDDA